jgi:hypothetical protein
MPRVAEICENRKLVCVEQDHDLACGFFLVRVWTRLLSATRSLRPSSKTCFMSSSPVKTPCGASPSYVPCQRDWQAEH